MGRPRNSTVENLEARWYDEFSKWGRADREAALKVLGTLHRHLPDKPGKTAAVETDQPKLEGTE